MRRWLARLILLAMPAACHLLTDYQSEPAATLADGGRDGPPADTALDLGDDTGPAATGCVSKLSCFTYCDKQPCPPEQCEGAACFADFRRP